MDLYYAGESIITGQTVVGTYAGPGRRFQGVQRDTTKLLLDNGESVDVLSDTIREA